MMQLNRVDRQVQTLDEAQHMLNELQRKRAEYDELFRSKGPDGLGQSDFEKAQEQAQHLTDHAKQLFQEAEARLKNSDNSQILK